MWRFITRTNSQDKKEKEVSFDIDNIVADHLEREVEDVDCGCNE